MCQIALSQSTEKVKKSNTVVTAVTVVRKIVQPLHKKSYNLFLIFFFFFPVFFGNCNLTHLTTDVMFSGPRFVILAVFLWRCCMIVFGWTGCVIFLLRRCVIFLCGEVAWFFVYRGCVNFLTHSLNQAEWFIFLEVAWFFFREVAWFFFKKNCVIFGERLCDFVCEEVASFFLCEEVAWFFCVNRLHDFLCEEFF